MVSPVDPSQTIARLAALMRQAMGTADARRKTGDQSSLRSRQAGRSDFAASLAERLRAVDPDHPRRRRVMRRMLVESLLTDEFGEAAANDAGFQGIVDDVVDAMEHSAATVVDLDLVVEALQGTKL